jgi:hypothetical protein
VTLFQWLVAQAAHVAIATAIAGLVVRRHARYCRSFTAYLAGVLVSGLLATLWPERFFVYSFWILTHLLFDVLKVAIVLELGYWLFLGFPGAAQTARGALFLLLAGTLAAVVLLPHEVAASDATAFWLLGALRPRLETAIVFMFAALAALITWYRIPVHPVHLGIVVGLVPYLAVSTTVLRYLSVHGLDGRLTTLEPVAYLMACAWWARIAWLRAPSPSPVVARLQPWRVSA